MRLNGLAVLSICISVVIVIGIYFLGNVNDKAALVGIMSGAVTNTPGLAAAQQTISELTGDGAQVNTMAQGYAAAYPLGVVGIIAAMLVIRSIFRIKVDKEVQIIEEDERNSQLKPYILTLKVTNALVEGQTLMQLHNIISANFVVSRLMNAEGKVVIPDCCNANVFM